MNEPNANFPQATLQQVLKLACHVYLSISCENLLVLKIAFKHKQKGWVKIFEILWYGLKGGMREG